MRLFLLATLLAGLAAAIPGAARTGCCPGPGGEDYAPVWSPDGSKLAFTRHGPIEGGTHVVRPDGSGFKKVSPWTKFAWAPDGQRLVIGGAGLDIVDTEGQVLRRLTQGPADWYPAWSPDGRTIAFRRSSGIWTISTEGGAPRRLIGAASSRGQTATSQRISWSPDSTRLAYVSRRGSGARGDDQLHVVDVAGAEDRVLAGSPANEQDPSWSPDGMWLAYSSGRAEQLDVYAIRADGTEPVNLSARRGYDAEPAWSPDGGTIAFASSRSGSKALYLVPATGGPSRLLTRFAVPSHPSWSPDGARLAFMGRTECRRTGIAVISVAGGQPDLITNDCYIDGSDANDSIRGTWDRDIAHGRAGNDVIGLDTGDDDGWGDQGNDVILGGRGNDVLVGGSGRDKLFGGRGNDRLFTVDGEVDSLTCGDQVDRVVVDRLDRVNRSCERVRRVRTP